jgi:hypothetical protein
MPPTTVFSSFSNPVQTAIREKGFAVPTEPQIKSIPPIMAGKTEIGFVTGFRCFNQNGARSWDKSPLHNASEGFE